MTAKDCHVNRAPTSGYIKEERRTPFLFSPNVSMLSEENDLLDEAEIDVGDLSYLFCNEKRITSIYNPRIKDKYYIIQIAERDVDVIVAWYHQGHIEQGSRFGQIRFGSQVDIVLPLTGKNKYEIIAKRGYHVEAGIDKIVRIVP
jgi:phosphatidylserine decarboxylase